MLHRDVLTTKLGGFGTTIFAEMSALALRTGAINLGQGFPDTDGPPEVLDAAVDAIRSGVNQYPPGPGLPVLREAIAAHQQRFYGLEVDPETEVLVTAGASAPEHLVQEMILHLVEHFDAEIELHDVFRETIEFAKSIPLGSRSFICS